MTHRGFTLVEVMVALLLAGLTITLAYRTFGTVTDSEQRLVRAARIDTRRANARRWLSDVFEGIEVRPTEAMGFSGRESRMQFRSWMLTPDGWTEPRTVVLEATERALVVTGQHRDLVLFDSVETRFDYLVHYGVDSPWLYRWQSQVSPPLAVRIRMRRLPGGPADTLVFVVGEQG